jgi:tetratricopeptide (TPR) repeat protein
MTGTLLLALGELDAARSELERQQSIMQPLIEQDPANFLWQRQRALGAFFLGRVAVESGNLAQAERHFRTALAVMAPAVASNPDNLVWRRDTARLHQWIGSVRLAQGAVTTALAEARAARTTFEALVIQRPDDPSADRDLAGALVLVGQVLDRAGQSREAIQAWERAAAIGAKHADSTGYWLLDPWAASLIYLGRLEDAVPILRRLDAMGYRRQELTRLRTLHHLEVNR